MLSFVLSLNKSLPAGGTGEVGSVVDRRDGLVHQRVRLDESQSVVGEGSGRLVGSRRALTGTASRPVQQQRGKKREKHRE